MQTHSAPPTVILERARNATDEVRTLVEELEGVLAAEYSWRSR